MKVEIGRSDLAMALKTLGSVPRGRGTTGHVVFRVRDGVAELLAFNNRVGVAAPLAGCTVAEIGEGDFEGFNVDARPFRAWVAEEGDGLLELEVTGPDEILARSRHGSIRFRAAGVANFPWWEEQMVSTPVTTVVPTRRLSAALAYLGRFVAKPGTHPRIEVVEVIDGVLRATNGDVIVDVRLPELRRSKMRVHGRDLPHLRRFLAGAVDEGCELREHERSLFVVRRDGATMAVGRPHHRLRGLALDTSQSDEHSWTLDLIALRRAVGAAVDGAVIRLHRDGDTVRVSGRSSEYQVGLLDARDAESAAGLPGDGVALSATELSVVLAHHEERTVRFGLNPTRNPAKPGGWACIRDRRANDDYVTVLVWRVPEEHADRRDRR